MNVLYQKRSIAFAIDLTLVALCLLPIAIPVILFEIEIPDQGIILIFLLFFSKDLITPQGSYGKKIMGLQLIKRTASSPFTNKLLKVVRNISLLLWPLEILIALSNKGLRLGDLIAGSEVVGIIVADQDSP